MAFIKDIFKFLLDPLTILILNDDSRLHQRWNGVKRDVFKDF